MSDQIESEMGIVECIILEFGVIIMLQKSAARVIKSPPTIQHRVKTFEIIFLSFKLNSFIIEIFEDYNICCCFSIYFI